MGGITPTFRSVTTTSWLPTPWGALHRLTTASPPVLYPAIVGSQLGAFSSSNSLQRLENRPARPAHTQLSTYNPKVFTATPTLGPCIPATTSESLRPVPCRDDAVDCLVEEAKRLGSRHIDITISGLPSPSGSQGVQGLLGLHVTLNLRHPGRNTAPMPAKYQTQPVRFDRETSDLHYQWSWVTSRRICGPVYGLPAPTPSSNGAHSLSHPLRAWPPCAKSLLPVHQCRASIYSSRISANAPARFAFIEVDDVLSVHQACAAL